MKIHQRAAITRVYRDKAVRATTPPLGGHCAAENARAPLRLERNLRAPSMRKEFITTLAGNYIVRNDTSPAAMEFYVTAKPWRDFAS